MSTMKWADMSDDSDEEEILLPTQPAGLNDGTVQASTSMKSGMRWADSDSDEDDNDEDDAAQEELEQEEEDDDEEEETEEERLAKEEALKKAREEKRQRDAEEEAKVKQQKKPLSKKERQALKAKELDDLDGLLSEMGLASSNTTTVIETPVDDSAKDSKGEEENNDGSESATKSKKKRKNRKKKQTQSDMAKPATADDTPVPATPTNIAAVMKAKAKTKEKTAAEKAAATAAKEAKAKPKKAEKKKKKKDKKLPETIEDTKTSRKRKSSDVGENEDGETTKDDESPVKKAKFDWDEVITACLKEKDGNEMKLVKLKKKCLREYFSVHEGTHKTKEEVGAKFDKKVKKRSYKVLKDRIKLLGEEEDEKSEEEEEVMQGAPSKPEGWQSAPDPKPVISFNKWEGADMGSDAQTEKFRRLMGIKAAPKPQEVSSKWGRDDKKMLRELERGFEKARETHFGGRSFTQ